MARDGSTQEPASRAVPASNFWHGAQAVSVTNGGEGVEIRGYIACWKHQSAVFPAMHSELINVSFPREMTNTTALQRAHQTPSLVLTDVTSQLQPTNPPILLSLRARGVPMTAHTGLHRISKHKIKSHTRHT